MATTKLIVSDIDGVWTDGGLYYDELGKEFKKFNVKDGASIKLLKLAKIPICIITAKDSIMVKKRATELNVDYLFQGVEDKISVIADLLSQLEISFEETAYIGDDFNDVPLLRKAGISATPADATMSIQREANWVMSKKGGEGVFREFVEKVLMENKQFETTYTQLINNLQH